MSARDQQLDALDSLFVRMWRRFKAKLPDENLTLAQLALLRELYHHGRLPMGSAAEALGISMAAATGSVDRLVQSGLVRRQRSESDRRVVWVELTEVARERMAELQAERRRHLSALLSVLSEQELATLVQLLERVVEGGERGGG